GYLTMHIACTLIIGFVSFSTFQSEENQERLNPVGKFIANSASYFQTPKAVTDFIYCYAKFTGTNRGYSFFSPNVTPVKIDLRFMADGKQITLPIKSQESYVKFGCANLHFNSNFFDGEEREIILKSISASLFNDYPEVDKIDVYLDLFRFNDLKSAQKVGPQMMHKAILGFSSTKNPELAMQTTSIQNQ
ncbi:MAG: hypothetical protein AAF617_06070, partial [Bacteroidota bacterium]